MQSARCTFRPVWREAAECVPAPQADGGQVCDENNRLRCSALEVEIKMFKAAHTCSVCGTPASHHVVHVLRYRCGSSSWCSLHHSAAAWSSSPYSEVHHGVRRLIRTHDHGRVCDHQNQYGLWTLTSSSRRPLPQPMRLTRQKNLSRNPTRPKTSLRSIQKKTHRSCGVCGRYSRLTDNGVRSKLGHGADNLLFDFLRPRPSLSTVSSVQTTRWLDLWDSGADDPRRTRRTEGSRSR